MFIASSIQPALSRIIRDGLLSVILLCGLHLGCVQAGEQQAKTEEEKQVKGLGSYVQDIFNTELPFTNLDEAWDLDIHPKFRDIIDEPFIRLPLRVTYGFTDSLEGSVGYLPYIPNPFKSDKLSSLGIVELGFKKRLPNFLDDTWDFAFGSKVQLPVDDVPFVNGYSIVSRSNFMRTQPFVVVSKRLIGDERLRAYFNVSYDWINRIDRLWGDPAYSGYSEEFGYSEDPIYSEDHHAALEKPKSLFLFQPGIVFRPEDEWLYSLDLGYLTSRLAGGNASEWSLKPGIRWYPKENTWFGQLPGDMSIGLTAEYFFTQLPENEHRDNLRVRVRVRWRWHRSHDASSH